MQGFVLPCFCCGFSCGFCYVCFECQSFAEREMRECAMFSVRPENRHSLHFSIIKFYNDGQVTCAWHVGRTICEHKVLWAKAVNLSLTHLRRLRQAALESKYRQGSDHFIVKPVSTRRIPLHPDFRLVCYIVVWSEYTW